MTEEKDQEQPTLEETPVTVPAAPGANKGSGQFAVWDHDLGQFVSGAMSKADAGKAQKSLKAHNGAVTDGHKLEVLEV